MILTTFLNDFFNDCIIKHENRTEKGSAQRKEKLQEKIKNWQHENDSENTISGHRLVIFNRMPRASPSTFLTLLFPRNMLRMEIHRLFAFMKVIVPGKKKTLQIGGSQQWFGIWYSNAWTKLGDRFGSELFDTASIINRTATDLRPNSQQLCDEGPLSLYKPFFSQRPRKIKSVERACVDPIRSSTKSDINPMVGHWASINRVFS